MKLSIRVWVGLLLGGTLLFLALGIATIVSWEYSNSVAFCSDTCHQAHPEEPEAYHSSPHAQVSCVECHLGRLPTLQAALVKVTHMRHVWALATGYERPTRSYSMHTASESCERCHSPETFYSDTYRVRSHYSPDENNTETRTHLLLHTGGGTAREGRGKGIHWHIENQVQFIATDPLKQNIPWVEVTYLDGRTVTYEDVTQPLSPEQAAISPRHAMDCLDCHNRVGHDFKNPEEELDQAIALGLLDKRLPFLKSRAMELLNRAYSSEQDAELLVEQARAEYERDYAWIAETRPDSIAEVAEFMKDMQKQFMTDLMDRHRFDTGRIAWISFPDNAGHKSFPGCFRCHDGKHQTADGEPIRMECNLCHDIPIVVQEGKPTPPILNLSALPQPSSHQQADFIPQHRFLLDGSCQACHGEISFGTEGDSFCSNPACHGRTWPRLDLDAKRGSKPVSNESS